MRNNVSTRANLLLEAHSLLIGNCLSTICPPKGQFWRRLRRWRTWAFSFLMFFRLHVFSKWRHTSSWPLSTQQIPMSIHHLSWWLLVFRVWASQPNSTNFPTPCLSPKLTLLWPPNYNRLPSVCNRLPEKYKWLHLQNFTFCRIEKCINVACWSPKLREC